MRGIAPLLVACAAAACDGPSGGAAPVPKAAARDYTFVLTGPDEDLPWNRTLYLGTTEGGNPVPYRGLVFIEREMKWSGEPGSPWHAVSEPKPTPAIRRMFWLTEARGTFGDETRIEIPLARRTGVRPTGNGEVTLTFADPKGSSRFTVVRSSSAGQRWAVWDRGDPSSWRGDKMVISEMPFAWREIAPGTWHVCARQEGLQWTWMELELRPGHVEDIEVELRPFGGGTVLTEDADDELVMDGITLPSHRNSDLTLRARWDGVPPGRQRLRRRDGTVTEIDVVAGQTVLVPPLPKAAPPK
ncbi:MAG: hypothetical protein HMLKMBBP_02524 [Planctomycetes bacterium]|nr:hypothetical protein [Planctomycetota bacterium]